MFMRITRIFWPAMAVVMAALLGFFMSGAASAQTATATEASCAATSTTALAANNGRTAALFVNDSTSSIYIRVGATAVANEGVRINANGGSFYISTPTGNAVTVVINCIIASGAAQVLLITEWAL